MKKPMPWLRARLHAIHQSPTALARALGVANPRVFEMIAGRRAMQLNEIVPVACFLRLPVATVAMKVLPKDDLLALAACAYELTVDRPWWWEEPGVDGDGD